MAGCSVALTTKILRVKQVLVGEIKPSIHPDKGRAKKTEGVSTEGFPSVNLLEYRLPSTALRIPLCKISDC